MTPMAQQSCKLYALGSYLFKMPLQIPRLTTGPIQAGISIQLGTDWEGKMALEKGSAHWPSHGPPPKKGGRKRQSACPGLTPQKEGGQVAYPNGQ